MNLQVEFDRPTAAKVADFFASTGMLRAATSMWEGLCCLNPYDRQAREKFGELLFDQRQPGYPQGTVVRSKFILRTINQSFPTPKLTSAYFENLVQLLRNKPKRGQPGNVALGVGSGRCGSTTLTAAIGSVPDACSTHECPPFIDWQPIDEQVQFHFERLRFLADYFTFVFDASHSWLNVIRRFFAEFPQGKVIGLHRETAACVRSFLSIKGTGRGSVNHWAAPGNGVWAVCAGDSAYPSYPVPRELAAEPDLAKAAHIERYVVEFNDTLKALAGEFPERLLMLPTETLSSAASVARLSEFVGAPLKMPTASLNAGGTSDSDSQYYWL